jgi:hypothetical protein
MKNLLSIAICTITATAAITAVDAIAQSVQQPTAGDTAAQQQDKPSPGRRKFRMKLTLNEPGDLRIREGDTIKAGQIISDRFQERARLEAQKAQIVLNLKQLDAPLIVPVPPKQLPPMATLPEPLYMPQWAAIDYERLKVSEAEEYKIAQLRKVEALKAIDGLPPPVMEHESQKIRDSEAAHTLAISQLKKAEAELERAKREQKQAEYGFALEISKREIAISQQALEYENQRQRQSEAERDRAYKKASLQQQLITIDNQIAELSSVKSPYDAKVQRVKFAEQNDRALIVDIVLAINASDRAFPKRDNPGAQTSPNQGRNTPTTTQDPSGD